MRFPDRRSVLKKGLFAFASLASFAFTPKVWAKKYLTTDQARALIWGDMVMSPQDVTLTKAQQKSIRKASKVRVRDDLIRAWRSEDGDWLILDQVIGKHENIDIAVGIDAKGEVTGIEILEYRETYGYEVANPLWRAQFTGRDSSEHLKLDKQIRNISGATLSCRHITDGINRLTHTWDQVLQHI